MSSPVQVTKNDADGQFQIRDEDKVASLAYSERDGKLYLIHTEVPKPLEGRGYGSALAKTALEYAKEHGLKVVPFCPFARAYLQRHPEYAALVKAD
ncbi:MAG TPA: GNAT family N-acetyltransferase [Gemmatimonadaceae bacterium]|nr:GNAT family N-acetyltransferase [Gemmatimonadaceae bacterium]